MNSFDTSFPKRFCRGAWLGLLLMSAVFQQPFASIAYADEASVPNASTQKTSRLTVDRIFHKNEFEAKTFSARWLSGLPDSAAAFTTLEKSQSDTGGQDIVRHDVDGVRSIMVSARDLIPPGTTTPLRVEDYAFSDDHNLLLVYTNSQRVWRDNTRGDYWLLDRTSRQLRQLGGTAPASSMMFAKLSPNGEYVAFVRQGNIFIEDVRSHRLRQLTHSDSEDVINGTTDWVYEEELGLRDAFQWSPDGRSIAYLQVDTTDVPKFPLVNNTDALYPTVHWFAYPKVGQRNPTCRIGIVDCQTAQTQWLETTSDMPEYYLPRLSYLPSGDNRLLIQQLNRLQNTNDLLVSEANNVSRLMRESDEAWVDVHDELFWLKDGQHFTWISERDGWRHVYLASLKDGTLRLVTPGQFDVIELLCVDEQSGWIYFIASPDNATQRYLYQVRLDGSDLQRITDNRLAGTHQYDISPDRKWAIHTASSADQPPVIELVSLPDHAVVRTLEDNHELRAKISQLERQPTEFFKVNLGEGIELDGWAILPPNRQPDEKVPLLVYVYGEPAGSTVVDRWGGSSYLWHLMLAQQGYAVMSFDNRGTKAPRGRAWRKSIYKQIGIIPPQDQAAAVRAVLKDRPYIDSKRVGIWGWSGGGSSSLHAIFKYPDLYHTAVAVAPVPNQRYYDTIYQERYMSLPELNVQGFLEGSPINFAKQLQGNLLLIHGTGDDNCHYQTMELLIDELIAHNKQFSLMTYPNRTHAIRERANTTRHLRQLMTDYLLEHLPPND
jgi:dipeptidyl-peptidase 4